MADGLDASTRALAGRADRGAAAAGRRVAQRLIAAFGAGGRVYTFGNGGSAADAAHFAEELVGRFKRERRPLPAQSLVGRRRRR